MKPGVEQDEEAWLQGYRSGRERNKSPCPYTDNLKALSWVSGRIEGLAEKATILPISRLPDVRNGPNRGG